MKLRNPWLIRLAALFGSWVFRLWMCTLRYRIEYPGETEHPTDPAQSRFIYAFWHESILVAATLKTRVHTLISQHADGELIAQICRRLGIGTVRGSSTRGAEEALLQLRECSRYTHIAVTPDGPQGPRRQIKRGLVFLASTTGLPVLGFGVGYSRAWRFGSWDRFALPWPFSTVWCVSATPVHVPAGPLSRAEMEHYRRLIEEGMLEATDIAERIAAEGGSTGSVSDPSVPRLCQPCGRGHVRANAASLTADTAVAHEKRKCDRDSA
jgi:lysophospholipid acyltransferase (LPLAT)-like uncharacterized protein